MVIAVAGGHGKVARLLTTRLRQRGDRVLALVRTAEHEQDLRDDGAEPVRCDLEAADESELAGAIGGSEAVVFAAGAGANSGAQRKWTVDYGAAAKLIGAARMAGVRRYVMVSAMGAASPPPGDEVFAVYLQAKERADRELAASGLDYTIVRPGGLTDEPPSGRVRIAEHVQRGKIPRADVADVLAAALHDPGTSGLTFELVSGQDPIETALAKLSAP